MNGSFVLSLLLLASHLSHAITIEYDQKFIDEKTTEIHIHAILKPHELVYKQQLSITVDHPDIKLSEIKTEPAAKLLFDQKVHDQREAFDENFVITTQATREDTNEINAHVHVTALSNQDDFIQKAFALNFAIKEQTNTEVINQEHPSEKNEGVTVRTENTESWTEWFKALPQKIKQTDSWLLRFIGVLLLGILLSFTPCIYPMIPITVGILQSQGQKSIFKNFLLSLAYSVGMASSFALMGLLAASSGEAFGHLLANPIFILCIVALLIYFALSLFGFYNLYIPRFLQKKGSHTSTGSIVSIFIFGMASGTVASPCLSPGLALVLTIVATLANKLLGFLLLFVFGIGLGVPLLIIGTFSGSINMLPRAGMWMLEIQKLFGFMLFGMCFYYLNNVMPHYSILAMLTLFALFMGIYYLRSVHAGDSKFWRTTKNIFGIVSIAAAVVLSFETYKEFNTKTETEHAANDWYTDYDKAITDAKAQNKNLLLDFWTPYCSICKAIAKKVLKHPAIKTVLDNQYIVLSVDASDANFEPYKTLRSRYDIQGVPTIIIANPDTGNELKRWQADLYELDTQIVIDELMKHKH